MKEEMKEEKIEQEKKIKLKGIQFHIFQKYLLKMGVILRQNMLLKLLW